MRQTTDDDIDSYDTATFAIGTDDAFLPNPACAMTESCQSVAVHTRLQRCYPQKALGSDAAAVLNLACAMSCHYNYNYDYYNACFPAGRRHACRGVHPGLHTMLLQTDSCHGRAVLSVKSLLKSDPTFLSLALDC